MKSSLFFCMSLLLFTGCFFNSGNDNARSGNTSDSITGSIANMADSMYHLLQEQRIIQDSIENYLRQHDSIYNALVQLDKDSFFMVGVWHASDCVGSGYSNLYVFYENGNFIYFENQMDCSNRMISFQGDWKNNGNLLILTIRKKTMLTGGKLIPVRDGSCGSDSMLVGAKEKEFAVSPSEIKTIKLSKVYYEDDLGRKTMLFDKTRYWRIFILPEEFEY